MAFRCCYGFTCKYNNSSLYLEYCGKPTLSGRKTGIGGNWEFCDSMLFQKVGFWFFLFVSVLFFVSNPVSVMVTAGGKKTKTLR